MDAKLNISIGSTYVWLTVPREMSSINNSWLFEA
ncbi:hypothetical protein Solca_1023 [Solitalea canadensis DSM 3403]|uniref:Uncharacterized protein n=1 Tax=Solitalea canadensis (strain ATCC 29591 / DSM 3403 / JCM 21819 / LMG 8368 / NBRC 15130 / NCIMB 12057 / USAM 9D) TaxID=929556 RepID=H8KV73_SOLCM|nr:hypothetical protein Solca_1023 [Solitalea canadensis DSM 3403]